MFYIKATYADTKSGMNRMSAHGIAESRADLEGYGALPIIATRGSFQ